MRARVLLAALGLLVVSALGMAGRVATVQVPPPRLTRTVAAQVLAPGGRAVLPWPASGAGALVVRGVGTVGTRRGAVPVPIASVAKIMTALVVLTDHPLRPGQAGPTLTLTAADAADYRARLPSGQSLLAVQAGEQLTERQALEGLLLPSADNIADVLARWDGGRVAFLARMNAAARAAGATATRYTDPSGLDPATVSTAEDQVRIAMVALGSAALVGITGEQSAVLPVAGLVKNYNQLLAGPAGVFGLKTGSTRAAGGCLVFVARLPGRLGLTAVGALLGVDAGAPPLLALSAALSSTAALLSATQVTAFTPLPAGRLVARLRTDWGPVSTVRVDRGAPAVVLPGAVLSVRGALSCRPPWTAGTACGPLAVTAGDPLSGTTEYPVTTSVVTTLPPPGLGWRFRRAFSG